MTRCAAELDQPAAEPPSDGASVIRDLDPALISSSFIADRMEMADESYHALRASIAAKGQMVPILVRPHPTAPGRYQVACGHRRLRAAAELGRPARALIRELTDREFVIAQGQENSLRANLSFIERARFAQALEERRYGRDTIIAALGIDKATASRLLSICRHLPTDVIEAIGPAPSTGRERWMKLARAYRRRAAERPVDPLLESPAFSEATSDQRFLLLHDHLVLAPRREDAPPQRRRLRLGLCTASATLTDNTLTLRTDRAIARGFGAFLLDRLEVLYEDYAASQRTKPRPEAGSGGSIRHSLQR